MKIIEIGRFVVDRVESIYVFNNRFVISGIGAEGITLAFFRGGCYGIIFNYFTFWSNIIKAVLKTAVKSKGNIMAARLVYKYFPLAHYSIIGNEQILTLEWIEEGNRNDEFWKTFGQQLASLHQISTEEFGLKEDNYMGSVPQINRQEKNWVLFFRANRLEPLVKLCVNKTLLQPKHQEQFEILYQRLLQIFDNEKPALIHGDLWSGNYMCDKKGMPVLIDPAVYFGHRSVDLAMTTLFGGFHKSFYQVYHHYFPLPENYREQWNACNLYPLLIHLYLFGKSYLSKIEQTLDQFC